MIPAPHLPDSPPRGRLQPIQQSPKYYSSRSNPSRSREHRVPTPPASSTVSGATAPGIFYVLLTSSTASGPPHARHIRRAITASVPRAEDAKPVQSQSAALGQGHGRGCRDQRLCEPMQVLAHGEPLASRRGKWRCAAMWMCYS
jgi:hypothetical protein